MMKEAKSVCEISQVARVARIADSVSLVGFKLGTFFFIILLIFQFNGFL